LPFAGLALLVFALTFLLALVVYVVVMALAVGERGEAFKAFSPGMLPPMGLLFGGGLRPHRQRACPHKSRFRATAAWSRP